MGMDSATIDNMDSHIQLEHGEQNLEWSNIISLINRTLELSIILVPNLPVDLAVHVNGIKKDQVVPILLDHTKFLLSMLQLEKTVHLINGGGFHSQNPKRTSPQVTFWLSILPPY